MRPATGPGGGRLPAELSDADFEYVRTLVHNHAAISLDESKRYLVSSRLLPLARSEGFDNVPGLVSHLRSRAFGLLHTRSVEAIATTETSFFRDVHPFDALRQHVLPELIRKRRGSSRVVTVWSAACSSGQEPYSVAMILRELLPSLEGWSVRVLASDLSSAMVDRAREGEYRRLEVNRGLPARSLVRWFEQDGSVWRVQDELRRMIDFFQLNLARQWANLPPVDLLLLRNVLIYFDIETRREILRRVRRQLKPDGYLVLGAAETTLSLDDSFERVTFGRAVFYQVKEGVS